MNALRGTEAAGACGIECTRSSAVPGVRVDRVEEAAGSRGGYNTNEPAQLCVLSAIEAAVGHLLAQGIERRLWQLAGIRQQGRLRWTST